MSASKPTTPEDGGIINTKTEALPVRPRKKKLSTRAKKWIFLAVALVLWMGVPVDFDHWWEFFILVSFFMFYSRYVELAYIHGVEHGAYKAPKLKAGVTK